MSDFLLRASGIGALAVGSYGLTKKQEDLLNLLTQKANANKITEKQAITLQELIETKRKPFQLSETAKSFIKEIWLRNKYGYSEMIEVNSTEKGLFNEEEAVNMLCELDGRFYEKNERRMQKGYITGECDIYYEDHLTKEIHDIKCSYNLKTFIAITDIKDVPSNYIYQLHAYMYLYDADVAYLRYVLTDTPEHLVRKEKDRLKYKYYHSSMLPEEEAELEAYLEPMLQQIERNHKYDIPLEQRVKTFEIKRNDELFETQILSRIPYAKQYYDSLTLGGNARLEDAIIVNY